MANYQPFLVSDLVSGKITRRDAWLLPGDGFTDLYNCNLKRGVLEKRKGRAKYGQIVKVTTDGPVASLSTNPVMGIYNHITNSAETLLVFDKERMNVFVSSRSLDKTITAYADGGGAIVLDVTCVGHGFSTDDIVTISDSSTTAYNGTYSITWLTADTFSVVQNVTDVGAGTGEANEEPFDDVTRHRI
ncbi:unnamed protein product, partial [marine sediment metagenome]